MHLQLLSLTPEPKRYQPQSLPRNERRRATDLVRLSFRVLEMLPDDMDRQNLNAVFASSGGDYDVVDRISRGLATPEKQISPTDFHNSVHNAAAGYWSIASQCHRASTSISAGDESFSVGLQEATLLCLAEQRMTILVAYDVAPPEPLAVSTADSSAFCPGTALESGTQARLDGSALAKRGFDRLQSTRSMGLASAAGQRVTRSPAAYRCCKPWWMMRQVWFLTGWRSV